MKYLETQGQLKTIVAIVKSRGSDRDRSLREYSITGKGVVIGESLSGVEGAMTGVARKVGKTTSERIRDEFARTLGPAGLQTFTKFSENGITDGAIKEFVGGLVRDGVLDKGTAQKFQESLLFVLTGESEVSDVNANAQPRKGLLDRLLGEE